MQYDNNKTGVLFKNMKKDISDPQDKKPDYTGNCEIEGQKYYISGWKRKSKKSDIEFLSLKLEDERKEVF